jgi:hypothetical protein
MTEFDSFKSWEVIVLLAVKDKLEKENFEDDLT